MMHASANTQSICPHALPTDAAAMLKPVHSDIPEDLSPRIQAAAQRSGLSYAAFVQQLLQSAFSGLIAWQHSDVERLFWLAERLGLDPLERDLIAIPQADPFPPSLGFMITVDGWVKLLHRHPRFRGLAFEEAPSAAAGPPAWVSCTLHWEGLSCPWVVREWAAEHRSLHESWLYYPHRMLRHKALAQCARLALGVGSGYWAGSEELGSVSADTAPSDAAGALRRTAKPTAESAAQHSNSNSKEKRYTDAQRLKQVLSEERMPE